jgi:HAD superfamily hydrolase (TIGR01457 family)
MDKLRQCKLFLLDMDGTLYLGDEVFPGAVDFLQTLTDTGRRYIYLTNNSSRSREDYVERLCRLGFPCRLEDVLTSGMATALYLQQTYPGQRVYLVGNQALRRELESYGICLVETEADVVVAGFDTELTYDKLNRAAAFLRHGAPFVAANPDLVCPLPAGESMPDCGSICALLTAATGATPHYIGKPNQGIIQLAAQETGVSVGEICCVGDRLYTDIAAGINAGAVSALVLSGETDKASLAASDLCPDYVFQDVSALGEALRQGV